MFWTGIPCRFVSIQPKMKPNREKFRGKYQLTNVIWCWLYQARDRLTVKEMTWKVTLEVLFIYCPMRSCWLIAIATPALADWLIRKLVYHGRLVRCRRRAATTLAALKRALPPVCVWFLFITTSVWFNPLVPTRYRTEGRLLTLITSQAFLVYSVGNEGWSLAHEHIFAFSVRISL